MVRLRSSPNWLMDEPKMKNWHNKYVLWFLGVIVVFVIISLAINWQIKSDNCYKKDNHAFLNTSRGWSCMAACLHKSL